MLTCVNTWKQSKMEKSNTCDNYITVTNTIDLYIIMGNNGV